MKADTTDRIDLMLMLLKDAWLQHPEWRLGQVITKAVIAGDYNAVGPMALANLGRVAGGMQVAENPNDVNDHTMATGLVALGARRRRSHAGWGMDSEQVDDEGDKDEDQQPGGDRDTTDETDREEQPDDE